MDLNSKRLNFDKVYYNGMNCHLLQEKDKEDLVKEALKVRLLDFMTEEERTAMHIELLKISRRMWQRQELELESKVRRLIMYVHLEKFPVEPKILRYRVAGDRCGTRYFSSVSCSHFHDLVLKEHNSSMKEVPTSAVDPTVARTPLKGTSLYQWDWGLRGGIDDSAKTLYVRGQLNITDAMDYVDDE